VNSPESKIHVMVMACCILSFHDLQWLARTNELIEVFMVVRTELKQRGISLKWNTSKMLSLPENAYLEEIMLICSCLSSFAFQKRSQDKTQHFSSLK
jgi:hypothetical protein